MQKHYLTAILALLLTALPASAAKTFAEVFPADFTKMTTLDGTGWECDTEEYSATTTDGTTTYTKTGNKATITLESNGLKVQSVLSSNGKYRADLKYNVTAKSDDVAFTVDADTYKIFAVTFVGSRPTGTLKLKEMTINGTVVNDKSTDYTAGKEEGATSWGQAAFADLEDADSNHTYYWIIGGTSWTGEQTIKTIDITIADLTAETAPTYTISKINWYKSVDELKYDIGINTVKCESITTEGETTTTTATGYYADITTAINAINVATTATEQKLTVKADQQVSSRLNWTAPSGVTLTVEGTAPTVKITRTSAGNLMFLCNNTNTLNLKNLTLDGNSADSEKNILEAGKDTGIGTVNIENVTVANAKTTDVKGFIVAKSGGKLNINGLTIEETCTVPTNCGSVFFGNSDCSTISGSNQISIGLDISAKANFSVNGELTNTAAIKLYAISTTATDFAADYTLVKNYTDASKFSVSTEGICIKSDGTNLVTANEEQTGIDELSADGGPVEYYNLQGIRMESPTQGVYIRRQGGKVSKVLIK